MKPLLTLLLLLLLGCSTRSTEFTEQDAQALYISDVIELAGSTGPQEAVDAIVDAMWLYFNAPNYDDAAAAVEKILKLHPEVIIPICN